jgi:hypothetical protein
MSGPVGIIPRDTVFYPYGRPLLNCGEVIGRVRTVDPSTNLEFPLEAATVSIDRVTTVVLR